MFKCRHSSTIDDETRLSTVQYRLATHNPQVSSSECSDSAGGGRHAGRSIPRSPVDHGSFPCPEDEPGGQFPTRGTGGYGASAGHQYYRSVPTIESDLEIFDCVYNIGIRLALSGSLVQFIEGHGLCS